MGLMHFISAAGGAKLALHDLGGSGPPLLILHCNSIPALAYLPLAEGLRSSYHCWGLDQRGHGCSAHAALLPVRPPMAQLHADLQPVSGVVRQERCQTVEGAQLGRGAVRLPPEALWPQLDLLVGDVLAAAAWLAERGEPVRVFGHSLGGAAALAAQIRQPGTFQAMYLFEPVIYEPHTSRDNVDSELLSSLALKRRTRFDDRSAAVASWASKLPFINFDSRALQLYAQHGLRDLPGGGVTLVMNAPRVEAWIYILIEPLAMRTFQQLGNVRCPAVLACGGGGSPIDVVDAMMPTAAARMPNGRLHRFQTLHHFGPLENPAIVAEDILQVFQGVQKRAETKAGGVKDVQSKL